MYIYVGMCWEYVFVVSCPLVEMLYECMSEKTLYMILSLGKQHKTFKFCIKVRKGEKVCDLFFTI